MNEVKRIEEKTRLQQKKNFEKFWKNLLHNNKNSTNTKFQAFQQKVVSYRAREYCENKFIKIFCAKIWKKWLDCNSKKPITNARTSISNNLSTITI